MDLVDSGQWTVTESIHDTQFECTSAYRLLLKNQT
jgi:hypothetical protein